MPQDHGDECTTAGGRQGKPAVCLPPKRRRHILRSGLGRWIERWVQRAEKKSSSKQRQTDLLTCIWGWHELRLAIIMGPEPWDVGLTQAGAEVPVPRDDSLELPFTISKSSPN